MAAECLHQAERGDPEAMVELGLCCLFGNGGVAADHAQAGAWFRQAVDHGHAEAMAHLGYCYYWGEGVPQDDAQAATWYHKAIAAGSTTGDPEYYLGRLYEGGRGVPESLPEAYICYRAGAIKGERVSKAALARLKEENPTDWPGWERE